MITIVGRDNGVGLSKDKDIITSVLTGGFDVEFRSIDYFDPLSEKSRMSIFTEVVDPRYFGKVNVLIPNQEWFFRSWVKHLSNFDAILVKSHYAYKVFKPMHRNVIYTGFTSVNMGVNPEAIKFREFFHAQGKSMEKGTDQLRNWPSGMPVLNLLSERFDSISSNIKRISHRLSDEKFAMIANRSLIHLCPSTMEGFGHYINEAKSMGCVVVTTDAPPMNELITDKRFLIPVSIVQHKPSCFGTWTRVSGEQIFDVCRKILDSDYVDLHQVGLDNQRSFFTMDSFFRQSFFMNICKLYE